MMRLLLVIFMVLFATDGIAQFSYKDPVTRAAVRREIKDTRKVTAVYTKKNDEIVKIGVVAAAENLRSKILPFPPPTIPLNLCANFLNPLSAKKQQCDRKVDYLRRMSLIVYEFTVFPTNYRMNEGIKAQILEKYASIINQIDDEVAQMLKEREKRAKYHLLRS